MHILNLYYEKEKDNPRKQIITSPEGCILYRGKFFIFIFLFRIHNMYQRIMTYFMYMEERKNAYHL